MDTENKTKIRRITIDDVNTQKKDVVFVDTRSATALKRNPEQIPSAFHLPRKELDQRAKRLPRNRTQVTYCS